MRDLAGVLVRERDAVEAVRKGRAEAVLVYLRLRPGVRGVPDALGEALRGWRASERSESIQRILDQALGLL
jgi:proteasome component ECM29